jgi:hypothetical protein
MLEHYDPKPRWTDKCPLPVLGIVISLLIFGMSELALAPDTLVMLGGREFTGLPAVGILLTMSAIMLSLAPLVFHCRASGWWGSLVLGLLWALSYGVALARFPPFDPNPGAGSNDAGPNVPGQSYAVTLVSGVVLALLWLGYVTYVRRYFFKPSKPAAEPPTG